MIDDLSAADRDDIRAVQNELGFILDEVNYERFTEIYAHDVEFVNPDGLIAHGVADLIAQSKEIKRPAVSHQVTNIVITGCGAGRAEVRTRGITVRADRSLAFSEATDQMDKLIDGWRIVRRQVRVVSGTTINQY